MKNDLYIIFGPPGSGKTIQANLLAQHLNLDHLSWGTIVRDVNFESKYKKLAPIILDKSTPELLRWKSISKVITSSLTDIHKATRRKGLILEGFPRNLIESKLLRGNIKDKFNIKALIYVNPSFEAVVKNYKTRLVCKKCHEYYPNTLACVKPGYCNKDGYKLESIKYSYNALKKEFHSYAKEVLPAIRFLDKYSETSFTVSGDDYNEVVIFSNILLKLQSGANNWHRIFERKSSSILTTKFGDFNMICYQSKIDFSFHVALIKGNVFNKADVVTRIHSSCITGDILHSYHCDCGEQLELSLEKIRNSKSGILIYLFQEGRGINIINKIRAYELQRKYRKDTVEANELLGLPAEMRDYTPVRDILRDLKVESINLLSNNPDKVRKITDLGITISSITPLEVKSTKYNKKYLATKKTKMSHRLDLI